MNEKTKLPAYSGALLPTVPTVAEVLKTAGYRTACFGKWHVSNTLERPQHMKDLNRQRFPEVFSPIEQYPTRRGFDVYWGDIWGVVDYFNPFSLVDGETPVKELPPDFYVTDAINDHAADYIKTTAKDDKPFFMYLAHHAPHWPLHARPEDLAKYKDMYHDGYGRRPPEPLRADGRHGPHRPEDRADDPDRRRRRLGPSGPGPQGFSIGVVRDARGDDRPHGPGPRPGVSRP